MMLSPASQLLLRSEDTFTSEKWLFINPTDSQIASEISNSDISVFHQYFDVYQQSARQGQADKHLFAASYPTEQKFDGAVLYMPKSKAQAKMLLANAAACLKPEGSLLLVGENKGGVKSAAKMLETFGANVNKIDSARHCALFGVQLDKTAKPFKLEDWQSTFDVSIGDSSYKICSLPGVFNHGEVDIGTRLLLEHLPAIKGGKLLDFGCGAGVIGCFLGLRSPQSQIVMSDVSALAIHCAQQSAAMNKVNAEVIPSNGLNEIQGKFAGVYTNPPFHTGIQTDYSVTEGFISQLKRYMLQGATLTLVANRFLRYSELLEQRFHGVDLVAQTTKFSLYHCARAK